MHTTNALRQDPTLARNSNRLAVWLGLTAAVLAWGGVTFKYLRQGELNWSMLFAGGFMAAFALSMRARDNKT